MALADTIRSLEDGAPRLYSRWSERTWRLACEGPAVALWDALDGAKDRESALEDYLVLLREAVGMQYLSASHPEDLRAPPGSVAGRGFLAVALTDALPRLLPAVDPKSRGRFLAQLWNAGEVLACRPGWLDRYLAARLDELDSLDRLEAFLARALGEGLDAVPPAAWKAPFASATLDPSRFDRDFLPGEIHLATPSIACVHDRRRDGKQVALLLRRGKTICLGTTPCLGREAKDEQLPVPAAAKAVHADLGGSQSSMASRGGFVVVAPKLSQRVTVWECAG
jgi:hypothetical protein